MSRMRQVRVSGVPGRLREYMRAVCSRLCKYVRRRLRYHMRAVPAWLREHVCCGLRDDVRGYSRSAVREARSPSSSSRVCGSRSADNEPVPKIRSAACPVAKSPSAWNVRQKAAPKDDDACRDASDCGMAVRFVRIADFVPGEAERRHVIVPTHNLAVEPRDG